MKKTTSCLLALTMALALATPTFAADDNKTTELKYEVASKYTVTISDTVTIGEGGTTATGTYGVEKDSLIGAGNNLSFTITGATNYDTTAGFRLKNTKGKDVYLGYTIKNGDANVEKGTAFLTASADDCNKGTTVTLTYTADAAKAAGSYTDTITITIAEVDATPAS